MISSCLVYNTSIAYVKTSANVNSFFNASFDGFVLVSMREICML